MRDEFRKEVKDVLASRVAHRCSRPECAAVTSGPAQRPDRAVSKGVAAHITAAAPGGPRYDARLTRQQRRSAENGIWLCEDDARLIDRDLDRFTEPVLEQWKAESELRAKHMLDAGVGSLGVALDLAIPALETVDSLLSFANTRIPYIGRPDELNELNKFLDDDMPFSWWLWTGPAGIGKSRLAVELCRSVSPRWHAGFLDEAHQSGLGDLQAVRPTLVIVDYASQRSTWLSEALVQLGQRRLTSKVRILVLERQSTGLWWETVQRHHRMVESATVATTMYALPNQLRGLDHENIRLLIEGTAAQLGHEDLTSTQVEDIADKSYEMDPNGSPLFIQIAVMDWLDAHGASGGRDDALRRLIARTSNQMGLRLGGASEAMLARRVQLVATALGGLTVEEYVALSEGPKAPVALLPDVFGVLGSVTLDELLDGVRPDIVGELFVLDQVGASGTAKLASTLLLHCACLANPDAYQGFVERAAADHAEHLQLAALLLASVSDDSPLFSAELGVAIIPLLKRSNHPVVEWVFERLATLPASLGAEVASQLLTTARLLVANLVLSEGDTQRASELFTDALADCDPSWPEYGKLLNNRGAAFVMLGQPESRSRTSLRSSVRSPPPMRRARRLSTTVPTSFSRRMTWLSQSPTDRQYWTLPIRHITGGTLR